MKIAVSSAEGDLDASIDRRFGRAAVFVVQNTETGETTVTANEQNVNAAQGAGIQAAQKVARAGADVVITGHCGPKAFRTLHAAGIAVVIGASGTVRRAISDYENGVLTPTAQPDVEGHWI